jgi:hypothetical protein
MPLQVCPKWEIGRFTFQDETDPHSMGDTPRTMHKGSYRTASHDREEEQYRPKKDLTLLILLSFLDQHAIDEDNMPTKS